MLVTTIRAAVRLSRGDSEHGSAQADRWHTVELGAEAQVYPGEDWQELQRGLYADLNALAQASCHGQQAMALLGNGHQQPTQQSTTPTLQPTALATDSPGRVEMPEGWCPIHNLQMPKHTHGGQSWYSHKLPDGNWCKGR